MFLIGKNYNFHWKPLLYCIIFLLFHIRHVVYSMTTMPYAWHVFKKTEYHDM